VWFSAPSFWIGGGLESSCVGRVGAVARHHPHRTHDLLSGSQDHHLSKNSVQKTIRCNSTSNAPDDGRMYPKHVELRIHQYGDLVASSWHFTLFHFGRWLSAILRNALGTVWCPGCNMHVVIIQESRN